jgi:hypothetical protein
MPDITPSFVMQYERRMRTITESEYARRLSDTWWNKVCKTMPIEGLTERVTWFLETAMIEPVGPSGVGVIGFENLVTLTQEFPSFRHARGISVHRDQLEDLNGTGLNSLQSWSTQIGSEIAYYPQRLAAQALLNGANTDGSANAYDSKPFFSAVGDPHPYNPFRTALGGYANWLKSSPSGSYPGACPIHDGVTVDVALQNISKVIAYVASIKMPNGVDPRYLKPAYILGPPRMAARLAQLTDAKFVAQDSENSGGSADVVALIKSFGLGAPVIAPELGEGSSYNAQMPFMASGGKVSFRAESLQGSDTTWYLVCEENRSSQLGGLVHVQRKPFKVNYYTGDSGGTAMDEMLNVANEFKYEVQGRMSTQYGHPYAIFRVDAT